MAPMIFELFRKQCWEHSLSLVRHIIIVRGTYRNTHWHYSFWGTNTL